MSWNKEILIRICKRWLFTHGYVQNRAGYNPEKLLKILKEKNAKLAYLDSSQLENYLGVLLT